MPSLIRVQLISTTLAASITIGRKLSECGQIGVMTIASIEPSRIGPPADRLYAVEPVGVETISPSPTQLATRSPSTAIFSSITRKGGPAVTKTSLTALE